MNGTARPWASFAGRFVVTNLGLLAVGATLPAKTPNAAARWWSPGSPRPGAMRAETAA